MPLALTLAAAFVHLAVAGPPASLAAVPSASLVASVPGGEVAFGRSVQLTGLTSGVDGARLEGAIVRLEALEWPYLAVSSSTPVDTSADGSFRATMTPAVNTLYRAVWTLADGAVIHAERRVWVAARPMERRLVRYSASGGPHWTVRWRVRFSSRFIQRAKDLAASERTASYAVWLRTAGTRTWVRKRLGRLTASPAGAEAIAVSIGSPESGIRQRTTDSRRRQMICVHWRMRSLPGELGSGDDGVGRPLSRRALSAFVRRDRLQRKLMARKTLSGKEMRLVEPSCARS